jgi:hypothetical protein
MKEGSLYGQHIEDEDSEENRSYQAFLLIIFPIRVIIDVGLVHGFLV